ncbi:hypothetical protein GINT2_001550 [Glugoides intestinalis]
METMVSNSNNIEQVIYLWQDLVWSIQPEGLLSTKSCIVISIVVFFIMTLRNGEMYYNNNLLNGFLTILLTIIPGIIFGKGLEILFRTLYIICSGAYGNVVFSLADIFISLLFGCIFVSFGYCLLFNKKLRELLRLQKSEDAKLKEIMANNKAPIVNRIKALMEYLKLKIKMEPEETGTKLKNVWSEFEKTMDSLNEIADSLDEIADSLDEIEAKPGPDVKAELEEKVESIGKLTSDLSEKLLNYELNEAGPEEIKTELQAIVAGFKEYKEIFTKEKAAKESELKATMLANDETLIVFRFIAMRNYLKLTMVGKPKETRTKLKNVWIKIDETLPKLYEIGFEIKDTWNSLNEMKPGMNPDVKAELEEKDKNNGKLTSDLSEKLLNYELNEAGPEEIEAGLQAIEAGLDKIEAGFQEYKEILTKERARLTQVPTN